MNWHDAATTVRWNIQPFVAGDYRPSASKDSFDNINPANELPLCRASTGSSIDVDTAVQVARRRFNDGCWSEMPGAKRAEVLLKWADLLVARKSELALLDTLEMGKPIQAALNEVTHLAAGLLRSYAGFCDKLLGVSAPFSKDSLAFSTYEPRGVVGAIIPWNFPVANAALKLGPALAAGNSVVLKPSEVASSSALKMAELALSAGVPEGVLNVVPGLGSTVGTALATHMDVDLLSFTGSTATGRRIMELAGRSNGKPLLLECGGKSPHLVFSDVQDLDVVAEEAVRGVVWNQGQVCSARTRLLVHEQLKESLIERVVLKARKYRPTDPLEATTTFGPLASPSQRDRVKAYIDRGLKDGAVPRLMGMVQGSGGCNVEPTIFDQVQSSMSIAKEEIFGPVLCVQTFRTDEEALSLANETEYGLAATVWTRDIARAKRFGHAIRAGHVCIRTGGPEGLDTGTLLAREPQKASGFGAEVGLDGLQSYSTRKSISLLGS